ncbi:hypothetical protein CFREI_10715 [Corynebacterium freiburgense]|nr:hypothetical protein CFREI_10715 [Corynebacterium freiburgense]
MWGDFAQWLGLCVCCVGWGWVGIGWSGWGGWPVFLGLVGRWLGAGWALVGRVVTDSIFSADFMESATR